MGRREKLCDPRVLPDQRAAYWRPENRLSDAYRMVTGLSPCSRRDLSCVPCACARGAVCTAGNGAQMVVADGFAITPHVAVGQIFCLADTTLPSQNECIGTPRNESNHRTLSRMQATGARRGFVVVHPFVVDAIVVAMGLFGANVIGARLVGVNVIHVDPIPPNHDRHHDQHANHTRRTSPSSTPVCMVRDPAHPRHVCTIAWSTPMSP